jgi:formate/nitrite transporter FocA (FNT family)
MNSLSFATAILAGMIITLMTWMEHSTPTTLAQLVASVIGGFLLAAGKFNHAIVGSLDMFAGLHAGAPYGYLDWAAAMSWATLGNVLGSIGLVTVLRLVQAGERLVEIRLER